MRRTLARALVAGSVVACALLGSAPALAHGGGTPQLSDAPAGPYRVFLWTQPEPLRAGDVHVTVAVTETPGLAGSAEAVLGADVQIRVRSRDGQTITAQATHEAAANKLLYEADLSLADDGLWSADIIVSGPAGTGQATVDLEILPARSFRWTWIGAGLVGLLTAVGLLGILRRSPRVNGIKHGIQRSA